MNIAALQCTSAYRATVCIVHVFGRIVVMSVHVGCSRDRFGVSFGVVVVLPVQPSSCALKLLSREPSRGEVRSQAA